MAFARIITVYNKTFAPAATSAGAALSCSLWLNYTVLVCTLTFVGMVFFPVFNGIYVSSRSIGHTCRDELGSSHFRVRHRATGRSTTVRLWSCVVDFRLRFRQLHSHGDYPSTDRAARRHAVAEKTLDQGQHIAWVADQDLIDQLLFEDFIAH